MSTKLRKDRKRNNKPYFKAAKVPTYPLASAPVPPVPAVVQARDASRARIASACPTCGATGDQPCMTNAGKVTKRHAKREAV